MTLRQLTAATVARVYASWAKHNPSTRANYHSALRTLLRTIGTPNDIIATVPSVTPGLPRSQTANPELITQLLEHAKPDMRLFILLCSDAAIRSGTAVRISERNYQPDTQTLTFLTKGNVTVTQPTTARLRDSIETALLFEGTPDTPLVERLGGWPGRWSAKLYRRHFKELCQEIDREPVRPHDLRRSQARRLYRDTHNLQVVQSLLGHRKLASTFTYLHPHQSLVTPTQMQDASEDKP